MPIWLYIYNPWIMIIAILAVLLLNFAIMLLASLGVKNKNHFKFALSKLMFAFLCAAVTIAVGYVFMGIVFTYADEALQNDLLRCNYSSMNVLRVPIVSLSLSAIVGYIMSRYILFKADFDKVTRTALSCTFVLLNLPYVLVVPIVI